jgi:hypothetical protein
VRWLQQRNRPVRYPLQCRLQEPKLSDARLLYQQLNKRAQRPPATGQLRREGGVSRVHRLASPTRELGSQPKGRMDTLDEFG